MLHNALKVKNNFLVTRASTKNSKYLLIILLLQNHCKTSSLYFKILRMITTLEDILMSTVNISKRQEVFFFYQSEIPSATSRRSCLISFQILVFLGYQTRLFLIIMIRQDSFREERKKILTISSR